MSNFHEVKQLGITYELSNCKLTRIELDDEHFYYMQNDEFPDGEFCASVTHVIDTAGPVPIGLREFWKGNSKEESEEILRKAGDRGKKLHNALEELLNEMELNLERDYTSSYEKEAIVTFIKFFKFLQPYKFKSELIVASPERKVAGTLDFVGQVEKNRLIMLSDPNKYLEFDNDGMLQAKEGYQFMLEDKTVTKFVLDWKFTAAIRYAHRKQIPAYMHFYNASYANESPVEGSAIWHFNQRYKFKFSLEILEDDITGFDRLLETYIDMNGGKLPKPKNITVFPKRVRLVEAK